MKSYAVLRVAKLKTLGQLGAAVGHNTRQRPQPHADNNTPLMGGGVRHLAGSKHPVQALQDRLALLGVKPRKGAVLALEFVASASPEWFQAASPEEREEWVSRTLLFLTKRIGGRANILAAHLHDDEATPHLHLLAVPLVQKRRKKPGRKAKRTRSQERPTESLSWALSAADLVGDRKKLEGLQSGYGSAVAALGIRRGRPRALTGAQHKSPAQYRQEVANHAAKAKQRADELISEVSSAMTLGFDAVDRRELEYRPPDEQKKERLVPGPNYSKGGAWEALRRSVRPAFAAVLGYAKAQARLLARETELDEREENLIEEASQLARMAGRIAIFEAARRPALAREAKSIERKATRVRQRVR